MLIACSSRMRRQGLMAERSAAGLTAHDLLDNRRVGVGRDNRVMISDETRRRLLDWSETSANSERLAAVVLAAAGYERIDPIHPRGGPDHGRDADAHKDGQPWIIAVYFPIGEKPFGDVKTKFLNDLASGAARRPFGLAFVTNQPMTDAQRRQLRDVGSEAGLEIDLFHLERVAHILDMPTMHQTREDFLGIGRDPWPDQAQHAFTVTVQSRGLRAQIDQRSQAFVWPMYVEADCTHVIGATLLQRGQSLADCLPEAVLDPSRSETAVLVIRAPGVGAGVVEDGLAALASGGGLDVEERGHPVAGTLPVVVCGPGFGEIMQSLDLMLDGAYGGIGSPTFAWWLVRAN